MDEIVNCLKEYCKQDLDRARREANDESKRTAKSVDDILPEYLSKLYYRSMLLIMKYENGDDQ
jgi:hypothetical protein